MSANKPLPVVVLISGSGSNLQAIIDATQRGELPVELRAVISNQADAYGLKRAQQATIPTEILDHAQFSDRPSYDKALQTLIDQYEPGLVVLAGFMRILTPEFVEHYLGRMINIHPALLPKFPGLHTHQRAIEENENEHGATVHFVTSDVDSGPVIIQARVPVHPEDTPDVLAARVLEQEHKIYPEAIRLIAEGHITFVDNQAIYKGTALAASGINSAIN